MRGFSESTDAGKNWASVLGNNTVSIAIPPSAPDTIYAGTSIDLFKNTNAGRSWVPAGVSLINNNIISLTIDSNTPGQLYAGTRCRDTQKAPEGNGQSWSYSSRGIHAARHRQL